MTEGTCRYQYNASEQYALRGPGGGTESHCGGKTFAISDEPEIVPVTIRPDSGNPYVEFVKTGVLLPREQPDPYCPKHGGTPEPQARIVMQAEVIDATRKAQALQAAYAAQLNPVAQLSITQDAVREPVPGSREPVPGTREEAKEAETNG